MFTSVVFVLDRRLGDDREAERYGSSGGDWCRQTASGSCDQLDQRGCAGRAKCLVPLQPPKPPHDASLVERVRPPIPAWRFVVFVTLDRFPPVLNFGAGIRGHWRGSASTAMSSFRKTTVPIFSSTFASHRRLSPPTPSAPVSASTCHCSSPHC